MRILFRPAKSTWFYDRDQPGRRPFVYEVNEDCGEVIKLFMDGSREIAGHTVRGIKHIAQLAKWRRAE